ncbi:universal stress protein [Salarchaeum japonicum]|uniref:UspA domain-containing protein n=1 Tax=Salarchaeum japonicum TaxID=555573 RepID=A0AAV3T2T4_9EURY|nr:universal stress protein [Salarchaeum japonicum]
MYEDVLLPFDGSDGATAVLQHAAALAEGFDATVHVLFVADTTRDSVTVVEGRTVDALAQQGEDIVAEAERLLAAAGVDHESDVMQGNPAPTIAEYAAEYGHDLVVMPTHGRRGVSRYLAGSVTEKVVRLSPVPVLTARMREGDRLAFPYEAVLLPTDGSPGATRAAEHGLALAGALDATVHALSVVDTAFAGFDVRSPAAGEAAAEDALDDLAATAAEHGVEDVVRHVEQGSPVEGILDCIDDADIDAVVMGTSGRRGTDRILLGSVAEKTVRAAPVPVVTVGDPDQS